MNVFKWFFIVLLGIFSLPAMAGEDPPIVSILNGKSGQIKKDSTCETFDPVFFSGQKFFIDDTTQDVYRNTISLLINEDDTTLIPGDFTFSVWLKISWTAKSGIMDSVIKKLEINYRKADSLTYDPRNYFYFDEARRVSIEIDSIDNHGASWDVSEVLLIENRMTVNRNYLFDCNEPVVIGSHTVGHLTDELKFDELIVNWDHEEYAGITHYDLEWSWIDFEALDRYKVSNLFNAELIFRNNSTRITVASPHDSYKIPMLYDGHGYLFYRVRRVQQRLDGQVVEGLWSATGQTGIQYFEYVSGHEPNLNWQASTTYAEDGKRKTVIQYFDGTLRSRQTVTKDNVTDMTVVAETFYDYQGRPAINVLPAPTLNRVIEYAKGFNRYETNVDPKELYDLVPIGYEICTNSTPLLDQNYGAAKYYSESNEKVYEGVNQYIPHSLGYPYAETRYVPDATGRIAAQGGVGYNYQINSGQETRYFYGVAAPEEIVALFGTEVGDASHYFKNMVRDANGQYSVSYTDMHGRTVATALADRSQPATNANRLQTLESWDPQYLTRNLLTNNTVKGRSIESTTTLLVPIEGEHRFQYSLSPESLEVIACNPEGEPVCFDCYYDLEIRIIGTCGQPTQVITRKNFTFGNYDVNCGTPPPSLVVDETFILQEGEYNIVKTLTLSKDAQDWYRENLFAQKKICKELQTFYDEIYEVMLATNNCQMTCESCTETLGTYTAFRAAFLESQGIDPLTTVPYENEIQSTYDIAKANCDQLCGQPTSKLALIRRQMLEDMIPSSGQYAIPGIDKPFNIFKPCSSSASTNCGDAPYTKPRDKNGAIAQGYPDQFGVYNQVPVPSLTQISPDEFSHQFKESWAEALLYYHPEYCRLQLAESQLSGSYQWDAELEEVDTWAEAVAAGYTTNILALDPFFANVASPGVVSVMSALINTDYNGGMSMWQIAWLSVNCIDDDCIPANAPVPPYTDANCPGDLNNVWRIFRMIYLTEKDKMLAAYFQTHCPLNSTDLSQNGYVQRFNVFESLPTQFSNLLAQLQNANGNSGEEHLLDEQMEAIYEENCDSYIAVWKMKLLECDVIKNHTSSDEILNRILSGLKDVCFRGSDLSHPLGSSTVKPNDLQQPRSFEQVIEEVLADFDIEYTEICHPYIITHPAPYASQQAVGNYVIIEPDDDCVCNRIGELELEKVQSGLPESYPLNEFIENRYGIEISPELIGQLKNGCDGVNDCETYDPPLEIPAILNCNTNLSTCIGCDEYSRLKAEFMQKFPGFTVIYEEPASDAEVDRNTAFVNFMNARTGLNKTLLEYLAFEESCEEYEVEITCTSLQSVITEFRIEYPNAGSGGNCEALFVAFFNAEFGTSYNFQEISELFQSLCGAKLDICERKIDCKTLQNFIHQFVYENPGIDEASDCQTQFVDAFNIEFGTNYNWYYVYQLYYYLCPSRISVCQRISEARLQQVVNAWKGCNSNAWMNLSCELDWVNYFNNATGSNFKSYQIDSLYRQYNISFQPCTPVIDGQVLENLRLSYLNSDSILCPRLINPDCDDCFTSYANERLGQNYSYSQLALSYKRSRGIDMSLCEQKFDPADLTRFTNEFLQMNFQGSQVQCDSAFTAEFNNEFSSSYSHDDIMAIYLQYFEEKPKACSGEKVLNPERLQNIFSSFKILYPDPKSYFGGNCDTAFAQYFNQLTGDSLSFAEISLYYWNLTEAALDVCTTTQCDTLAGIQDKFVAEFGSLQLPRQLSIDVFTKLFNNNISTGGSLTFAQIKALYDSCVIELPEFAPDSSQYLLACERLEGAKKALRYLNGNRLTDNCAEILTAHFNQYYNTTFTDYYQLTAWASDNCSVQFNLCNVRDTIYAALNTRTPAIPVSTPPRLCNTSVMFPPVIVVEPEPCDDVVDMALNAATEAYNQYVTTLKDDFDKMYREKCLSAGSLETFTVSTNVAEHHFTLYYYDQAGNLVKTIPPKGVNPNYSTTFFNDVKQAQEDYEEEVPLHTMATEYRYNTLNQVVMQKSPDGGTSRFWYDVLGRLVVSQNAKQALTEHYSYTKYDELGRITEVGQLEGQVAVTQEITQDKVLLQDWFEDAAGTREQITNTVYDLPANLCSGPAILCQQNLRNRVSYSTVTDLASDAEYASATYYTYDLHGNVDVLLQHFNKGVMKDVAGNSFKKIVYDYDLISGKVNQVSYQPGVKDQFYHRYNYDPENRLTEVYTSHDKVYWERQASYTYYRHGPLARTEIGQLGVQGIDYAYTLQGWLKGVNNGLIKEGNDMGRDGEFGARTARDAYAFTLNYYDFDYASISDKVRPFFNTLGNGLPMLVDGSSTGGFLFNGNISSMLVSIPKLEKDYLYGYRYDQLNRLVAMNAYNVEVVTDEYDERQLNPIATYMYRERINYDANGNILDYERNADENSTRTLGEMDNLHYQYVSGKNQLIQVIDDVNSSYTTDIDDIETQSTNNYVYDEIGNLVIDKAEGLYDPNNPTRRMIEWNVYGKISKITKIVNGNEVVTQYMYDASGNRIVKKFMGKSTAYVRDASGNVMSIYANDNGQINNGELAQRELHIYGSSRLGIWKPNRDVQSESWWLEDITPLTGTGGGQTGGWERGQTVYELSNHLGNVLVTISDRKKAWEVNGSIDHYEPVVLTANDYYPGGMDMPGRQYNATTGYRYGFNGKENDNDINGGGQDYGMRIYDRRLVRFLSVDPITSKYPELTPYQFASNTPIQAIDFDGLEAVVWRTGWFGRTVSKPKLKQGEWYEIHNYFISYIPSISLHKESFKEAIVYNAQNNRSGAYSSISQRHDFYKYGQELLSDKGVDSKWFEAASVVTSWNAIGGADLDGFGLILGKDSRDFLTKGNEFLFSKNIQTFNQLYSTGRLNIDYRTSNGKPNSNTRVIIHDSGGEDMDYAMVMYEQLLVQDFISSYRKEHPKKDMNKIFKQINEAFNSSLGNKQVKEVLKSTFTDKGREFDFSSYDNRVELGKALVDKLREKKE